MSNKTVKNELEKCTKYSNKIIKIITKKLEENNIEYKTKNDSEIIIKDMKKEKIKKILDSIDISNDILKILIGISSVNDTVYIRRKFTAS